MKKKKDKVTLPNGEVDKPQVFQHWTKDGIIESTTTCPVTITIGRGDDDDYSVVVKSDGSEVLPPMSATDPKGKEIIITYQEEKTGEVPLFKAGIDPYHIEPIDNPQKPQIGWVYINSSARQEAQERRLIEDEAFALNLLKAIKKDHPEVLKQFLEDGK